MTLPATILRKPRQFTRTGAARLTGKLEFEGLNGIIVMVDHEVVLQGSYVIEFSNDYSRDGRNVSFRRITYTLDQVVN